VTYAIVQASPDSKKGLQFYGGAREFWRYKEPEAMLSGPYETGKTIAALTKLHTLLCKYPNSRALMLRKTYKSLVQSAVVTYEKKVLPYPPEHHKSGIQKYGGERPEFYDYPNGSRLVCGGLDNADKVLSAEYDFIYVNQAEELTLDDWEKLTGRATGRAGNAPYTQLFGDCNPDVPTHWILNRKTLKVFEQRHEHNPNLFNQETGEITAQGQRTMAILDALTGVRHKRGRQGLWVAAEGQVYEGFDPDIHVIDPFPIPAEWTRYRTIDFGYTNPFVCQWWAVDHDGRLYLYRELYMTKRTVKVHADKIKSLDYGETIYDTIADHDAEDRATLAENGIYTTTAIKDISRGIQAVEERLKVLGDKKPRLYVMRDCLVEADHELYREYPGDTQPVCTEQEFSSYVWPDGKDGKANKEVPLDAYNHGMDAMRYMVMALDDGSSELTYQDAPDALKDYRG
jgi:PBSX family phage terminase large subunit